MDKSFVGWTPRKCSSSQLRMPPIGENCASSGNTVVLYKWYLKRLVKDEVNNPSFNQVAVGGYTVFEGIEDKKFETSAIEERIEKCKLRTIDGLYVHLMGVINQECMYRNGFSYEFIYSFLTGFPFTWEHIICKHLCANSLPKEKKSSIFSCFNSAVHDNAILNDSRMYKDNKSLGDIQNDDDCIIIACVPKKEKFHGIDSKRSSKSSKVASGNDGDGLPGAFVGSTDILGENGDKSSIVASGNDGDGLPRAFVGSTDILGENGDKRTRVDDSDTLQIKEENSLQETNDQARRRRQSLRVLPPPLPPRRVQTTPKEVSTAFGLRTSRSGRLLVPPLAHWCNERIKYDLDGGIIAIFDKSNIASKVEAGFNFQPPKQAKARKMQKKLWNAANEIIVTPKGKKQRHAI